LDGATGESPFGNVGCKGRVLGGEEGTIIQTETKRSTERTGYTAAILVGTREGIVAQPCLYGAITVKLLLNGHPITFSLALPSDFIVSFD